LVLNFLAFKSFAGLNRNSFTVSAFPGAIWRHVVTCLRTAPALLAVAGIALGSLASAQTIQFSGAQSTIAYFPSTGPGVGQGGLAADLSGNVYIAEFDSKQLLKETPTASGYVESTIGSGLNEAFEVAVDSSDNVYVLEMDGTLVKETPTASGYTQTTLPPIVTPGGSQGLAVDAKGDVFMAKVYSDGSFFEAIPSASGYAIKAIATDLSPFELAVAVDGSGNAYISDALYHAVYKETLSGTSFTQSTVATGFVAPYGIAVDKAGNVYVADYSGGAVYKETLSTAGYTQSTVTSSGPGEPLGIAVDGSGNLYINDSNNNLSGEIVKLSPSGGNFDTVNVGGTSTTPISAIFTFDTEGTLGSKAVVTQGATGLDFIDAGTGSCTAGVTYNAGDTCTVDVTFAPKFPGTRYGAAELLSSSRQVLATGYFQGTGVGPQVTFLPGTQSIVVTGGLKYPTGIAVDSNSNVYVADTFNDRVLKETRSGGSYTQSTIPASNLSEPMGVAVDGSGSIYIADTFNNRVLKETPHGATFTQSTIPTSRLSFPLGVAVDGSGNVYVADTGNDRVLKETLSEGSYTESTIPASGFVSGIGPFGIAVDGSGSVYLANFISGQVLKETPSAGVYKQQVIATIPGGVTKVALDGTGDVYIASAEEGVFKETLSGLRYIQSKVITSALIEPQGIAVDSSGNVYIADTLNQRILKEDFADPPSLRFGPMVESLASGASPMTVTIENVGNATLTFPIPSTGNNPNISANFTLNSSGESACPLVTQSSFEPGTLAAGSDCVLSVNFTPSTLGFLTGSLVVTDNALNAAAPGYAKQRILMSGTATKQ
jgi:sugar lactone lactonase YvrE